MATFGRNRQSVADIENQLHEIFNQHPNTRLNDAGEPVVPADNLVDVFKSLADLFGGLPFLNDDETAQLKTLIKSNPGMEVTPQILLGFIAQKTRQPPPAPRSPVTAEGSDNDYDRGRSSDRDDFGTHQRESSSDSNPPGSMYHSSGSRRSSVGPPQTPTSAKSPFDTERRQRSQPLGGTAPPPSSWAKRPAPAHARRKSDAGSRSDSESSPSPRYFGRTPSRHRTPSNPVSPSSSSLDLLTSPFSPTFTTPSNRPPSRPHSRAQSQPQSSFVGSPFHDTPSRDHDDDMDDTIDANPLYDYRGHRTDGSSFLTSSISSLPMPRQRSSGSESDSDGDEDSYLGLVLDRTSNASTASMEPLERLDALQRANTELGKKLMEAERTLQAKLFEHEAELEDMQVRLEEVRSELSATKREEKELRSKERQNMTQIAALEAEIAKVTKGIEHARSTYSSLQKQYQEQCTLSEKYRDDLRERDELVRTLRDTTSLHELELLKWSKEHDAYESRIIALEQELEIAQAAHGQLDEQKQENLLLKETIDRMRWDMDEMRTGLGGGAASGNVNVGVGSNGGSVSKSLGAELLGKMGAWGPRDDDPDTEGEEEEVEEELGNVTMGSAEDGEEDDGEDVIQTIITRTKRKVTSRANRIGSLNKHAFEETKEYSDSTTQYDPSFFYATHSTQTLPEPLRASLCTQTDPEPAPPSPPTVSAFGIQTDSEPEPEPVVPRVLLEMEIQTEDIDEDQPSSPPGEQVESLASSSSTILPSTPKASSSQLMVEHLQLHGDSPPAYNQISPTAGQQGQGQQRLLAAALRKWHPGSLTASATATGGSAFAAFHLDADREDDGVSFEPVPGGISQETVDDWKAFQEELGVGCAVIDKIVANSVRVPRRPPVKEGEGVEKRRSTSGRFYNIYNKFYIGDKNAPVSGSGSGLGLNKQTLPMWVGASALVLLAISPYMLVLLSPAAHYSVLGGPTYYDRSAWASFNGMQAAGEGFGYGVGGAYGGGGGGYGVGGGDGTAAVWNFLGRVGDGAARIARGWPT